MQRVGRTTPHKDEDAMSEQEKVEAAEAPKAKAEKPAKAQKVKELSSAQKRAAASHPHGFQYAKAKK